MLYIVHQGIRHFSSQTVERIPLQSDGTTPGSRCDQWSSHLYLSEWRFRLAATADARCFCALILQCYLQTSLLVQVK